MTTTVSKAALFSDSRDAVGESPVWSVAEQALYWVDIEGRRLHRQDWQTRTRQTWQLQERVGCIALSDRGTVIAAMESGVFEVRLLTAPHFTVTQLASIDHPESDMRFNDGRCDASGRFWISTMVRNMGLSSKAGGIYCLDERGLQGPLLKGFITANGMAFSPDNRTAYLSDSHPSEQKIYKHDFALESGTWGPAELLVDMKPLPGRPDGAAMDTQGCYWICGNDAGQVHRFSRHGDLLESLHVPMSKPSMCCFGGPELRHLLVTSIRPPAPVNGFDVTFDGAVVVLDPGVQGLPEPVFSRFPVR